MERKNILALGFFAVMLVVAIGIRLNNKFNPPQPQMIIGGKSYPVLVAWSDSEQFKGLGDRDGLGDYIGMFFDFYEPGKYGIVMRGMRFSLDVVWLNGTEVVYIEENLPLQPGASEESLKSYVNRGKDADSVLELAAGTVKQLDIKVGDKVVFCDDIDSCRR